MAKKQDNKIVIFDFGGVIESHSDKEYNTHVVISNIMKKFGIFLDEVDLINKYTSCYKDELNNDIGIYNTIEDVEKYFFRIKKEFNLDCNFDKFCKVYEEEFSKIHYYKEVVQLAHNLKKYCNIGILSNLTYLDKKRLDYQVNLKEFDYAWLSFELGYIKPDKRIYEIVEKDCKILPSNILFIDDTLNNLEIAKQRGWNVCLATGNEVPKIKLNIESFLRK